MLANCGRWQIFRLINAIVKYDYYADNAMTEHNMPKFLNNMNSNDRVIDKVSHFKVSQKNYDALMKSKNPDIAYFEKLEVLVILGKPVFIDDSLGDFITVYERPEKKKTLEESWFQSFGSVRRNFDKIVPIQIQPLL